jgi:hypothetical protein
MTSTIPDRVVDTLAKLQLFTPSRAPDGTSIKLTFGEEIFGVYRNDQDVATRGVMITDNGIHIQFLNELKYVRYTEIRDLSCYTWDLQELADPENRQVMLFLNSGERIDVHIVGAQGCIYDMTHFHNFMLGAMQARKYKKYVPPEET